VLNKRILTTLTAILLAMTMSQAISAGWNGGGGGQNILSEDEIKHLKFIREEEKLARDCYWLLGDKWGLPIFDNISESEQRHMDAIKKLIDNYGLLDPVENEGEVGGFVNPILIALFEDLMEWGYKSPLDGLLVGGAIEEYDILDIQHAIEQASHADIIETYESLVCGSRNHLRSFVRQVELLGEAYVRFIMTEDEFDAIIDEDMETDCGNVQRKRGNR